MTEKWIKGEVVSVKHWTESLYSIRITAPEVKFIAGQYTKIGLNINNQEIARPYSFVNSPNDKFLEFYSVSVPNGPLSSALQKLKNGDQINIGPNGNGFLILNEIPEVENIPKTDQNLEISKVSAGSEKQFLGHFSTSGGSKKFLRVIW